MSERNALENGIVSGRGDCPQTSDVHPMQAKNCYQSSRDKSGRESTSFKVRNRTRLNFADKIAKGDHVGIVLDQAKVDRPDSCLCCKREVRRLEKLWDQKKTNRVIVWEGPKEKFRGISMTSHDYITHELPKKEVPPWHPHRIQPWKSLDVPSVTETTYSSAFGPPRLLPLRARTSHMQYVQECQK